MRTLKKTMALVIAVAMVLTTFGAVTVSAATYADTNGHWAESVIDTWSNYGVIQGDGGYFRPEDAITRAEVAQVTQNVIGYVTTAPNAFVDVPDNAWYADPVLKLVAADVLTGNGDGTMTPDANMTREEAMTMLSRAYGLAPVNNMAGITNYADYSDISEYAQGYIGAMTAAGYVGGYPDGTIRPKANIARGEFVKILDNMIKLYITGPGTYGPGYFGGIVIVKSGGVTLNGVIADKAVVSPLVSGNVVTNNAQLPGGVLNLSSSATVNSEQGSGTSLSGVIAGGGYGGGYGGGSSSTSRNVAVNFYVDGQIYVSKSVKYNSALSACLPVDPTAAYKSFVGWYLSAAEAADAANIAPVDPAATRVTRALSLYAGFVDAGEAPGPQTTSGTPGTPAPTPAPTPTVEPLPEGSIEWGFGNLFGNSDGTLQSGIGDKFKPGSETGRYNITSDSIKDVDGLSYSVTDEHGANQFQFSASAQVFPDGRTYNWSVKTGGDTKDNDRVFTYDPKVPGTLVIYAKSGSGSKEATVNVKQGGNTVGTKTYQPGADNEILTVPGIKAGQQVRIEAAGNVQYYDIVFIPDSGSVTPTAAPTQAPTPTPGTSAATPTPGTSAGKYTATLKVTGGTGELSASAVTAPTPAPTQAPTPTPTQAPTPTPTQAPTPTQTPGGGGTVDPNPPAEGTVSFAVGADSKGDAGFELYKDDNITVKIDDEQAGSVDQITKKDTDGITDIPDPVTFGGKTFTHKINVRMENRMPSKSYGEGTTNTSVVFTPAVNGTLKVYIKRQAKDGAFTTSDNKNLYFSTETGTHITGDLAIDEETLTKNDEGVATWGNGSLTYSVEAGTSYYLYGYKSTANFYGFDFTPTAASAEVEAADYDETKGLEQYITSEEDENGNTVYKFLAPDAEDPKNEGGDPGATPDSAATAAPTPTQAPTPTAAPTPTQAPTPTPEAGTKTYEFNAGDLVTYTGTPSAAGQTPTLKVTGADGADIKLESNGVSFIMPKQNVTVDVTYGGGGGQSKYTVSIGETTGEGEAWIVVPGSAQTPSTPAPTTAATPTQAPTPTPTQTSGGGTVDPNPPVEGTITWDFSDEAKWALELSTSAATSKTVEDITYGADGGVKAGSDGKAKTLGAGSKSIDGLGEISYLNIGASGSCYAKYTAKTAGTFSFTIVSSGDQYKTKGDSTTGLRSAAIKAGSKTAELKTYTTEAGKIYESYSYELAAGETIQIGSTIDNQKSTNGFWLANVSFTPAAAGSAVAAAEVVPDPQVWTSNDNDLMTAATGAADGVAFGPVNELSGYGKWAKHAVTAKYTHNGTDYNFSNAFQAGSGSKNKRSFYFTPQQACIVTVAYAASAGRPVYIYQGDKLLNSGEEGLDKDKNAAVIDADIEDPTAGDVYIYGGSSNKDIFGIFVDYYDPTVIVKHTVSGTIDFAGQNPTEGAKIVFTDTKDQTTYEVPFGTEYTVELRQNRSYDITVENADGTKSEKLALTLDTNTVKVARENVTHNIKVVDIAPTEISGDVVVHNINNDGQYLDLSKVALKFTANDAANLTYEVAAGGIADNKFTVTMMPGHEYAITATGIDGYELSELSGSYVMAPGDENPFKNILLCETIADVPFSAELTVGADKQYATISDAITAIDAMTARPEGEAGRVTIKIDPGTYTEQVMVTPSYVTLKAADENARPEIHWYYGIGYIYYSAGDDQYYSEDYAVQKTRKSTVTRWGAACRVTGSNVIIENIVFKNTFNCEIVPEELADGVASAGAGYYSDVQGKPERNVENYNPKTQKAVERAAAIALDGTNAELYKCDFISSQDTFYTNKNAYIKDCYIEGGTDFIFGGNSVLFDDCTLAWHGYSDSAKGGYLTACQTSDIPVAGTPNINTNGYLFRNTTITNSKYYPSNKFAAGGWGRNWGGAKCQVVFDGVTIAAGADVPGEWVKMGGDLKDSILYVNNVKKADGTVVNSSGTSFNPNKTMEANGYSIMADEAYFGEGWTPVHYGVSENLAKSYLAAPGETITIKTSPKAKNVVTVPGATVTPVEGKDGYFTFEMPAADTKVNVEF